MNSNWLRNEREIVWKCTCLSAGVSEFARLSASASQLPAAAVMERNSRGKGKKSERERGVRRSRRNFFLKLLRICALPGICEVQSNWLSNRSCVVLAGLQRGNCPSPRIRPKRANWRHRRPLRKNISKYIFGSLAHTEWIKFYI